MTTPLALLLLLGVLGAIDTLWYHEYRTRLCARVETTRTELRLHVARDAVYTFIFGGLAWLRPGGALVVATVGLLATEIVITMADFVVEDRDRPAIGGMAAGERVLHSLMAIVYGAVLATLLPVLARALGESTLRSDVPLWMSWCATVGAIGIAMSGVRDAFALRGIGTTLCIPCLGPATAGRG